MTDDEALDLESPENDIEQVLDAVSFFGRLVVLRNHSALDDSTKVVDGLDRRFELDASDLITPSAGI